MKSFFRRRRPASRLGTFEHLEARELLSATGSAAADWTTSAEVAPSETDALADAPVAAALRASGPLNGTWTFPTEVGTLTVDSVQKGNRVRGTVSLTDVDPNTLPFPDAENFKLPELKYAGKLVDGVLQLKFKVKMNLPEIGSYKVEGSLTASIDTVNETVSGHIAAKVNREVVLDTDFSIPLSDLSGFPLQMATLASATETVLGAEVSANGARRAVPRILNVSGDGYEFSTSNLGDGTFDVTQNGLYIHGDLSTNGGVTGTFDAIFKNNRATLAKGVLQVYFFDEPGVLYAAKFKIKFDANLNFNFSYGKFQQVGFTSVT